MATTGINHTDRLAMERTKLANERTFLAYFRTAIVFLSSGFAVIKLDLLAEIKFVGYFLIVLAPVLFLIGYLRYRSVRKRLGDFFAEYE